MDSFTIGLIILIVLTIFACLTTGTLANLIMIWGFFGILLVKGIKAENRTREFLKKKEEEELKRKSRYYENKKKAREKRWFK